MNGPVTRFASCRGSLGAGLHCPAPHMGEDAVLPEAGGGPCLIAGMCQPGKAPGLPSIMSGQVGHAVRVELCDPARMLHRRSGAVPASSAPATRCHAGYGAWPVAVFCSQHRPGRQSRPAALFSDRDHRQVVCRADNDGLPDGGPGRGAPRSAKAVQDQSGVVHHTDQLAVVDDRCVGEAEFAEQPGAVADVHVGVHADNRFGHDLVDIHALR
jgi:hypothetical protein